MKLSKRGEYALRALIDLGVARELCRPLLSISELSGASKSAIYVSQKYLPLPGLETRVSIGHFVASLVSEITNCDLTQTIHDRIRCTP